jgi:hypothetical protein
MRRRWGALYSVVRGWGLPPIGPPFVAFHRLSSPFVGRKLPANAFSTDLSISLLLPQKRMQLLSSNGAAHSGFNMSAMGHIAAAPSYQRVLRSLGGCRDFAALAELNKKTTLSPPTVLTEGFNMANTALLLSPHRITPSYVSRVCGFRNCAVGSERTLSHVAGDET